MLLACVLRAQEAVTTLAIFVLILVTRKLGKELGKEEEDGELEVWGILLWENIFVVFRQLGCGLEESPRHLSCPALNISSSRQHQLPAP